MNSPASPTPGARPSHLARYSLWTGSFLAGCAVVAAIGISGCSGGGSTTAPVAGPGTDAAKAAVVTFLEAIKRGDDAAAAAQLTTVARTKTEELGLAVAPPVNATARYEVKECEAVGEGGDLVHVGTVWTDTDEAGRDSNENIVWVVRLDPEGWRVVGMAMKVFDDLPPLLLNFEDPEDMIAKQEMVAEEMQRRARSAEQANEATVTTPAPGGADTAPAAVTAQPPTSERRR